MSKRKVLQKVMVAKTQIAFKKSIDELTEVIVENLREGYQSDLEPFEMYAHRIRRQVYENLEEFCDRFLQGYGVLLEELVNDYQEAEDRMGRPPPGVMKL